MTECRKARGLKPNYLDAIARNSAAAKKGAIDSETVAQIMGYGRTVLTCVDMVDRIAELIFDYNCRTPEAFGMSNVRIDARFPMWWRPIHKWHVASRIKIDFLHQSRSPSPTKVKIENPEAWQSG